MTDITKLARERLEKIKSWRETYGAGSNVMLPAEEAEELARIALAVMDSEPVAEVVSIYGDPEAFGEREIRPLVGIQQMPYGTKLYRHAQPAQEYPEVLPCPVLLEPGMRFGKGVKIRLVLEAIQRRAEHCAELEAMTPDERAEYDANIEAFKAMLPQPAPLVPDGYVMVPKEATEKMLIAGLEEANPLGGLIDWDASRGDCNTREQVQEIFKAMLAAAPQEVKSES